MGQGKTGDEDIIVARFRFFCAADNRYDCISAESIPFTTVIALHPSVAVAFVEIFWNHGPLYLEEVDIRRSEHHARFLCPDVAAAAFVNMRRNVDTKHPILQEGHDVDVVFANRCVDRSKFFDASTGQNVAELLGDQVTYTTSAKLFVEPLDLMPVIIKRLRSCNEVWSKLLHVRQ